MSYIYKLCACLVLLLGCGLSQAMPTIRFVTSADYPPFESRDITGNVVGFDISMAQALCQHMGVKCTFTDRPWDTLIPSLRRQEFDAIISALSVTEDRKHYVNFTTPYFKTQALLVMHKQGDLATLQSLEGKTIGVQSGTIFWLYLQQYYAGKIKMVFFDDVTRAFDALQENKVDGFIADAPVIRLWLKQADHPASYYAVEPSHYGVPGLVSHFAIAVRPDDEALLAAFNDALTALKEHGLQKKIIGAYFDAQVGQENQ